MKLQTPSAFQKLVHRFLMLRLVSAFLSIVLHRGDAWILKMTGGKHTVTEIVGLPIIQLITIGATTGLPRTSPLVSLFDEGKIALIASNFGKRQNPGWYHNLRKNPICTVRHKGRDAKYQARVVEGEEREKYWQLALAYYGGYEAYQRWAAAHRSIPVVILERVP